MPYSDKENVNILTALLVAHGIRHAVVLSLIHIFIVNHAVGQLHLVSTSRQPRSFDDVIRL